MLGRGAHTLSAIDSSGFGRNGTLTNMDPPTDWVWSPELNRYSLDFDGSNDLVAWNTPITSADPQMWCGWVKFSNVVPASRQMLFTIGQLGSPYTSQLQVGINQFGIGPSEGTGRMTVVTYQASANPATCGAYTTKNFASPVDTTWHHIAAGWTGAKWTIFIDGVEDATQYAYLTSTQVPPKTASGMIMRQATSSRPANAWIADSAFWKRFLSPSEIQLLATRDPFYGGWIDTGRRVSVRVPETFNRRRRLLFACGA